MGPTLSDFPQAGTRIPVADVAPPDLVTGMVDVFGAEIHKDIALIIIAAGCFFIGVLIGCLMPEQRPGQRRKIVLSAPMSFLLTSPIWFTLLSGDLIRTSIAPIDSFLGFAMGSGGVRGQMFAFGVVMVMGLLSAPILSLVSGLFQTVMRMLGDKVPKPDQTPPAQG